MGYGRLKFDYLYRVGFWAKMSCGPTLAPCCARLRGAIPTGFVAAWGVDKNVWVGNGGGGLASGFG